MVSWDDIRLFLLVAETGGLGPASRQTSYSPATLGRRMARLEQDLVKRLFHHEKTGYRLTEDGVAFLQIARDFSDSEQKVKRWQSASDQRPIVRISAGVWTSWYLAKNFSQLFKSSDAFQIEFLTTQVSVDIGHGHADIGIRNRRPDHIWLAGQKLSQAQFAGYAAQDCSEVTGWIGVVSDSRKNSAQTPSQNWLEAITGGEFNTIVSNSRMALDLARSGVGKVLLPTFVGQEIDDLIQVDAVVPELTHDRWLVSHHDRRHEAPIRIVLGRLADLFGK